MELRDLRYFVTVADAQSFTKAADLLGISQPAISYHIHKLERDVGTDLFHRLGRKIRLTSAGMILITHARQAIQSADQGMLEIENASKLVGGDLRMGAIASQNCFTAKVVADFVRRYPEVRVQFKECYGPTVRERVLEGSIDFGLTARTVTESPTIGAVDLFDEPLVLAFRKGHPMAKRKITRPSDIGDTPFALFGYGTPTRSLIDRYFNEDGFVPNACLDVDSMDALLEMIAHGDLCGLVPKHIADLKPGVSYSFLPEQAPYRTIAVLFNRRAKISNAAREFTRMFQHEARRLNGGRISNAVLDTIS